MELMDDKLLEGYNGNIHPPCYEEILGINDHAIAISMYTVILITPRVQFSIFSGLTTRFDQT